MNTKKQISFAGALLLWLGGIALLILADQVTKYLAISKLKDTSGVTLISGVLEFQYLENRGMAFGMLQGRQMLFLVLCTFFCIALLWLFYKIPKTGYYLPLILTGGILAGGALGNFIDRAFRGFVVDFIYITLIDFPVFNVADIYVVPEDVQDVVKDVFRHRLVLKSRARLSRKDVDKIMDEICATVHVPDRRAAGGRR